jgi:DNA polymerase-4
VNVPATPSEPQRYIAHLDMDAFYASVELLKYPELRGQAVVIGGGRDQHPVLHADGSRKFALMRDYVGRGVVTTSTYEARALGVFSAMGTMKAAKLAPDAILLPTDFDSYRKFSAMFKDTVARIAPIIENVGIDEIYIDLTAFGDQAAAVARQIKEQVSATTGLSCSIGLAPNKLLAKICSDLEKPNGLTILAPADVQSRVWPLPVHKINGVGPKAREKLNNLGIVSIGDLAAADVHMLRAHFGEVYTAWLCRVAVGADERPVRTTSETKSVSREVTFERDLQVVADRQVLSAKFEALCVRVADDLKKHALAGKTVGVKLKFEDFTTVTRDITLPRNTADPLTILKAARDCLKRVPFEKRIRLLGVRISTLSDLSAANSADNAQAELFPMG